MRKIITAFIVLATLAAVLAADIVLEDGSLTLPNGLTIDTSTLFVDESNNRVGVGTTSPQVTLDVSGTIATTQNNGLCLDGSSCSAKIYYNGSHVVIQG